MKRSSLALIEDIRASSPIPEEALRQAVDFLEGAGFLSSPPRPYEVQKIKELAQRFITVGAESEPVDELESSPLQEVTGEELLASIRGEVEEIRWHIDRGHEPPFPPAAYESEAVPWMVKADGDVWGLDDPEAAQQLRDDGEGIAERLSDLTGESWEFSNTPHFLRYLDGNGRRRQRWVTRRHVELWPLAEGTWRLHRATGFMQEDLVRHVLCGADIRLPRATLRRERQTHTHGLHGPFRRPIRRDQIVVHLLTPDLDRDDIHTLLDVLRAAWSAGYAKGAGTRKRLEGEDATLYRILSDLGHFSREGGRAPNGFWAKVASEWQERGHPFDGKDLEEALRARARRLERDLPELSPVRINGEEDT